MLFRAQLYHHATLFRKPNSVTVHTFVVNFEQG